MRGRVDRAKQLATGRPVDRVSHGVRAILFAVSSSVLLILPGMVILKLTPASWLDLFSIAVGLIGIHLAIKGNSKLLSAEQALSSLKWQMHRQSGSLAFSELVEPVNELMNGIRIKDWKETSETAVALSGKLESVGELYTELLDPDSRKQLDACRSALLDIISTVPLGGDVLPDDQHREIFQKCVVIHNAIHAVKGRVKLRTED